MRLARKLPRLAPLTEMHVYLCGRCGYVETIERESNYKAPPGLSGVRGRVFHERGSPGDTTKSRQDPLAPSRLGQECAQEGRHQVSVEKGSLVPHKGKGPGIGQDTRASASRTEPSCACYGSRSRRK
jgi:hypothetical protein